MSDLFQPKDLQELTLALKAPGRKLAMAGGTDLMVRLRTHSAGSVTVLDLSAMAALKGLRDAGGALRIGSMTTMTELGDSEQARTLVPALAAAASQVGSTQIRNRATIGGNVANAAQCADTIPALIALDADVELMNGDGALRRVSVAEFVTGIGRTLITEDEILTGFLIPSENLNLRSGFGKVGSRKTVTIAKVNCAAVLSFDGVAITRARVAFGSIGQRAFLSESVSEGLRGMTLAQLKQGAHLALFVTQVDKAIPGRDSLPYKRSAVRAVAEDIISQAIPECRG